MEEFNEVLQSLPFQFDIRTQIDDDLALLSQENQLRLRNPIAFGDVILYYPISFYDELGLSPIESHPINCLELIQEIKKNYSIVIPTASLQSYAQKRPDTYQEFIGRKTPVRLFDLIGGRYYIDSISPFQLDQGTFLLNLIF